MLRELRARATGFSAALLDETEALLSKVGHRLRVEHAVWSDGEFHVTAHAPGIASEVAVGDYVYAGFFLAHAPEGMTEAGVRVYRVACRNGALADEVEGQRIEFPSAQPPAEWSRRLGAVVARSFDGRCLDEQTGRFRVALEEMLSSPYECLLHLRAQGLITDDEQASIQREFDRAGDATLYGLVNAVTRLAHSHRSNADWRRALAVERLGGEIAGGEHRPPIGSPVFR
jgi:hypothetical protein